MQNKLAVIKLTPSSSSTLAVILERHCPSMRSMATGNRFGDLLPTSANLKEIPECDYFLTTLARGENISFENDGSLYDG